MTEEEKKEKKHQWYLKNKKRILEKNKQYYIDNKGKILNRCKQYYQDNKEDKLKYDELYRQKNKDKIKEYSKKWREENPDYAKQWFQNNKEKRLKQIKEYNKQYSKTPMGRASYLLGMYNQSDIKSGRGKGDLTAKWIINYIFTKPCAHCGKTGWKVIGCNRLDNSKPHTKDNVEPCCRSCNCKISGGRPKNY